MTLSTSLLASLLAVLARPRWWLLGLAGFLVRGGILVVFVPVVTLPTVAGLANAFGPTLVGFVFGGPSLTFLATVAAMTLAAVLWLVLGGAVGSALDLELVRDAASDDELESAPPPRSGGPWRALGLRLTAHIPTMIVLGIGAVRLIDATYTELTHPGDPAIPIPVRIALRIPEVVGLLAAAWLLGETAGGVALRHLAWGASMPGALRRAIVDVVRPAGLVTLVATSGAFAGVVVVVASVTGVAWNQLRIALASQQPTPVVLVGLVVFSLVWIAGLWLVSLAVTWRSVAWTFEVARRGHFGTIDPPDP